MVPLTATELFKKGVDSLSHNHLYLAQSCFEEALSLERSPSYCSWLAYTLARTRHDFDKARALLDEALSREPGNSLHYLNLGRVHLLAGERQAAIAVWREGLRKGYEPGIVEELQRLGTRKPPLFGWLPRSHPVNKFAGILLNRLGLR